MENFNNKIIFNSISTNHNSVVIEEVVSTREINESLENSCKKYWNKLKKTAVKEKRMIWDSEIYRFESFNIKDGILYLRISTIPFSIRLSMNNYTEEINKLGISYAALGMYSSCFVTTADNKYLFIEKSNKYFSNRKYSFIGGILSKTERTLISGEDLFNEVAKEVKEEVGLSEVNIKKIRLNTGYITENNNFCLIFTIQVEKSFKEIKENFEKSSDGEASNVIGVNKLELKNFALKNLPERDLFKFKIMGFF